MNNWEPMSGLERFAICLVSGILLSAFSGCGPDPAPQNTNVAGTWVVTCTPASQDCPGFEFTFASNGDIINTDLPGQEGVVQGRGSIASSILTFNVGNRLTFVGTLDAGGNTATGTLIDNDLDGASSTTLTVTAVRQS